MIEILKLLSIPPHCCWCCREKGDELTNRDYFISTGKDTWDEGRVFICNLCFADMIRVAPDAIMKYESDEILSSMIKEVSDAAILTEKWNIVQKFLGIDVERILEHVRRIESIRDEPVTPEPVSDGDSSTIAVSDTQLVRDDPEPSESKPDIESQFLLSFDG